MKRILIILMVLVAPHAFSIALEDLATGEADPSNAGYSFDWDYAYKYNGSSAVAVDHFWILTAGHVAVSSGTIDVDGETYTQIASVKHAQADDPDGNPTADLALIKFDKRFPGYYPLHDAIPTGKEILVVGYGFPGDVSRSVFSGHFTEDNIGSRIRRWGTNKIDGTSTLNNSKGFGFTISGTRASQQGTPHEAGCNDKDSGSGVFYDDGGTWKLVGTLANRYGAPPNYSGNFAVGTKDYVNWIKSVIIDYDTDMNGLPDWWEDLYSVSDPSDDPDLDGFTNYEEWVADTNPNQGSSYLRALEFTNGVTFAFASSSNRVYQVERKDVLTNTVWFAATGWFAGDHPETATNLPAATPNRFYRVRAKLH